MKQLDITNLQGVHIVRTTNYANTNPARRTLNWPIIPDQIQIPVEGRLLRSGSARTQRFTAGSTPATPQSNDITIDKMESQDAITESPKIKCSVAEILEKSALIALRKCIKGFKTEEVKTTYELDSNGDKQIKNEVVTVKNIPPDFSAITFTLINLNPSQWSTKPIPQERADDIEEEIDLSKLSEQALYEISGLFSSPEEA